MVEAKFAGDKKKGESFLAPVEKEFVKNYLHKVPPYIETYHLTLMTIVWSLMIILFGYLAQKNIGWLWLMSIMIFFQYITDLFDGAIGRERKTGLIKWGYYMDHLLDYIFLCAILIAYFFILSEKGKVELLFIFALFGAFMVNAFLAFAATNEFQITQFKIGPTEIRILFILLNTALIIFGKDFLENSLPYALFISLVLLVIVVYKTQSKIWEIDMKDKYKE